MEQLSALESWWHWNAGGTGTLVALERLAARERWWQFCAGSSVQARARVSFAAL